MSDDRFMNSLREDPRPEFERSLRRKLEAMPLADAMPERRRFPVLPGVMGLAVAFSAVALILFPSVRASAQAFLDLFRVRTFTPVQFDPARFDRLHDMAKDPSLLIFDGDKGEPHVIDQTSRGAAEAVVGIPVLEPATLPDGLARQTFQTMEYPHVRVGTSTEKLRAIVDALDLRDVDIPENLDGQWADVQLQPAALQAWTAGRLKVGLVQARTPDVTLPRGVDIQQLGWIGLRILGLDRREADRISRSVDWHSTLLVPIPMDATGFREVTVRGQKGLLVTARTDDREHSVLLWTEADRVFALRGNISSEDLMTMAESLR